MKIALITLLPLLFIASSKADQIKPAQSNLVF
jgi:hypothetical protein